MSSLYLPDSYLSNLPLPERLALSVDIDKYRSRQGYPYDPDMGTRGYTTINVLPNFIGFPLCDLVLAYVHALSPTYIRVTTGEETTDAIPGRVTIVVDKDNKITDINQSVSVRYGCGYDVDQAQKTIRRSLKIASMVAAPPVTGNTLAEVFVKTLRPGARLEETVGVVFTILEADGIGSLGDSKESADLAWLSAACTVLRQDTAVRGTVQRVPGVGMVIGNKASLDRVNFE